VIYREIGSRIQQAREEMGLTQEELAARLGCTQSALSNYELGKRRLYLNMLNEIAVILNRPLDYFTDAPTATGNESAVDRLVGDPQLREILTTAAELPAKERQLVLDFINWRKNQT
jgi:transcriptional regulator with XRE-family HTH domain